MSYTTTLNVGHEAWLPARSVAEHVTAVVPIPNMLPEEVVPEGVVQDDDAIPELSTAAKVQVTVAEGSPVFAGTGSGESVVYGGQVSKGILSQ